MAKRIDSNKFCNLITNYYSKSMLNRKEIKHFAIKKQFTIPVDIWDRKSETRGLFDLSPIKSEINLSDNLKFEIKEIFEELESLTNIVLKGFRPSLLITGTSGVGKTHHVTKKLKENDMIENVDYVVIKGKTSTFGIFSALYYNWDKTIIFDDCDSVFDNEDATNLLKAALDSYDTRKITWNSRTTISSAGWSDDEHEVYHQLIMEELRNGNVEKLPATFEFKGKIIFISNLGSNQINSAVLSRSLNIDVNLTDSQIFARLWQLLPVLSDDLDKSIQFKIMNILQEEYEKGNIGLPNIRTLINAISIYKSGESNPEKLLKYV